MKKTKNEINADFIDPTEILRELEAQKKQIEADQKRLATKKK